MAPCTFCLDSGGNLGCTEVNNPNVIRFICQELKIDFDNKFGFIVDPCGLNPNSFIIPLCTECAKLFSQLERIRVVLDEVRSQLDKVLSEIKHNVIQQQTPQGSTAFLIKGQNIGISLSRNSRMLRDEIIRSAATFGTNTLGRAARTATVTRSLADDDFEMDINTNVDTKVKPETVEDVEENYANEFEDVDLRALHSELVLTSDNIGIKKTSIMKSGHPKKLTDIRCTICNKKSVFKNIEAFRIHVQDAHKSAPMIFSCDKPNCTKKFPVEILLKVHLKYHAQEKTHKFFCEACDIRFVTPKGWGNHYRRHKLIAGRREARCYCRFCKMTSIFPSYVRNHEVSEHQDKLVHSCDQCNQKYSSASILECHSQTHEERNGPFVCSICEASFEISTDLEDHLIQRHVPRDKAVRIDPSKLNDLNCSICNKIFDTPQAFLRHSRNHKKQITFSCELCPEITFVSPHPRLLHVIKFHESRQEKKINCTQCSKQFVTNFMYERHTKNHKLGKKRPFGCELCELSFKSDLGLQKHNKAQHDRGDFQYKCSGLKADESKCEKSFKFKIVLRRHERKHHPELFIYNCTLCEKSYSVQNCLETHMKTHVVDSSSFDCAVCIAKFSTALSLSNHLLKHTGEAKFQCTKCPMKYYDNSALMDHMRLSHGQNTLTCKICGKTFTQVGAFNDHKESHVNPEALAKARTCKDCGLEFGTHRLLLNHRKAKHLMKKKKIAKFCEVCGKTVTSFNNHMRMHNGIKNHACYFCDKSFVRLNALQCHIFTHTLERPFICKESSCTAAFNQLHCLKGHIKRVHDKKNETSINNGYPEMIYPSSSMQPLHQWYPISIVGNDATSLNSNEMSSVDLRSVECIDFDSLIMD